MNCCALVRLRPAQGNDKRITFIGAAHRAVTAFGRAAVCSLIAAAVCLAAGMPPPRAVAAEVRGASAELLRYTLVCTVDDEHASIECEAAVWVRLLRDSVPSVSWTFPSAAAILSIRDSADRKIKRTAGPSPRGDGFYECACPISPDLGVNDSVLFHIKYTVAADTSGAAEVFVNRREFLLQAGIRSGWVPLLSSTAGSVRTPYAPVTIELHLSPDFTVLSGGKVDSLGTRDGLGAWSIVRSDVSGWDESFCLAASKEVRPSAVPADKGVCGVTLYSSPGAFQSRFAQSLTQMLGTASRYFAAQGYRPRYERLIFGCVGLRSVDARPLRSGNLVLLRNGPEYAVFDSSLFTRSANNVWLQETARAYAFVVPDSSYWFDESWAGYLSTRFLFASADTTDRMQALERGDLLVHALDFFPTYPIAAGRPSRLNEDAVFLYKGRYVFMMLDYILGRETFDEVMLQLYARSRFAPPGISSMRSLCEAAYGSSLSWFFDQWLYRTGFPEYVMTSQTAATSRGTYDVTVTVTQRGDIFAMPLNVYVETAGRPVLKRIFVKEEQQRFSFTFSSMPTKVDWNPQYLVLRWIPHYRIFAHARTSISYRVFDRDIAASDREAQLTLQLDPENHVGANGIALFSLGKGAGALKDWAKAQEYFLRASQQRDPDGYAYLPLLSVVRRANIIEFLGDREKAKLEYRRALESAEKNPLSYGPVIIEARRYLAEPFVQDADVWYNFY